MYKNNILKVVVLLFVMITQSSSQIKQNQVDKFYPFNCESNDATMRFLATHFKKNLKDENEFIILVSHLGKKEKKKFHSRRLENLKTKLKILGISEKQIILTKGKKANGYGKVVAYVRGKIATVLATNKNIDLCVSCCEPDENYFPDRKQ